MWPELSTDEAERLCAAWRRQGITSAHDLRALLTAEARRRRWWIGVRARWGMAKGRRAVA